MPTGVQVGPEEPPLPQRPMQRTARYPPASAMREKSARCLPRAVLYALVQAALRTYEYVYACGINRARGLRLGPLGTDTIENCRSSYPPLASIYDPATRQYWPAVDIGNRWAHGVWYREMVLGPTVVQ